ncbi:MAG: hypothetical protein M3299_04230, partial [Thermoproteota archaeon]|nr:hypothetical protein [Thermoproteota archaeon]
MQSSTPDLDRPMLRMGSVAFIAGIIIIIVSTLFHATSEDLTNHPIVFAIYAESDPWIAAHIGEFAGVMLVFGGGFLALHRLLIRSESLTASALAWMGLAVTILVASTFSILQGVDGIALKRAVDSWYAVAPAATEEKAIAFRVAEGIRWIEIGINSMFRILQGTVGIIFGVAIAKSAILSRWIGGIGVFVGATTIIVGLSVAYAGFSPSLAVLGLVLPITWAAWLGILGIF